MTWNLPDEAVGAAARALAADEGHPDFDRLADESKEYAYRQARAALSAALPHLTRVNFDSSAVEAAARQWYLTEPHGFTRQEREAMWERLPRETRAGYVRRAEEALAAAKYVNFPARFMQGMPPR